MRSISSWLALLLLGLLLLHGQAAPAEDEPVIPRPRGFVSDFAGVLRPDTTRDLDILIRGLRERTGAEIAVVTVRTVKPLTTFDYAMKIAESWKVGSKEHDNGVVFLVAVADRGMYILTGYGVEGALPDGLVGEIRDRVALPAFRRGDYDGGIRAATYELADRIARDRGVALGGLPAGKARAARPNGGGLPWLPLLFLLAVFVFSVMSQRSRLYGRRRRHWDGGPGIGPWGGGFGGGFGGFGGGGGGGGGFGGFGGGSFGGGGSGGNW